MKNIYIITLALVIPLLNCFSQTHYIDEQSMDINIRPQDDLYNFVNGNWMKTSKIPPELSSWGSFFQLRKHTDSISLNILKNSLKNNYSQGSEEQKIKDLYYTYIDIDNRNKEGLNPILPYLQKVDNIKNLNDLQQILAELTPYNMNPFFTISVRPDMSNSKNNAVYLKVISLGLGRNYYQKHDEKSLKTLSQYKEYITQILKLLNYKDPNGTAEKLIELEKSFAKNLLPVEQTRNSQIQNNPYKITELKKISKNIDFPKYLASLGINTNMVIINEKKYYENIDEEINLKNLPLLKDYIKFFIIRNYASTLTTELDEINFDFYEKKLKGAKQQKSIDYKALANINSLMGEAFGKLYVAEVFPKEAKENMIVLIDYLKKSFKEHIKNLDWMSQTTKNKALEKLSKFSVKVGYPDKWKDYSSLEIKGTKEGGSYFKNYLNVKKYNYNQTLSKIGKAVDKSEWHMTPQTVNAYYNPSFNEIVFPAAILQDPFYNYKADPAVNFGGIGAVIGHEISHGFDDSGSQYDGDGNLINWWTNEDKTKFEKVTQALAEQYNGYEPVKGLHINGKMTLGENIADLGGLAISFDALKMYLNDNGNPGKIDNYTQEQRFFISWATIWRIKTREEFLINQLKTDPHSPGYYRTIGPVENIEGFYDAFNVKEGDKMFKPKNKRIKIW